MKTSRTIAPALLLMLSVLGLTASTRADDIDIFLATSTGSVDTPNIVFLIDNSPNWSRAAQHWPDNGGNQGQAELAAVSLLLNRINATRPANVGLAMLTAYSGSSANGATPGTGGGYIRFGVRDMTNATNRVALQNILLGIAADINGPAEKLAGMSSKDEDAGFYEIYKYLSGLQPYTGLYIQNGFADVQNNPQSLSANGQGLTSGFALSNPGPNASYVSPLTLSNPCAATYIIYIANNANQTGSIGQAAYEPSVANASPALTATPLLDTWTDEWTYLLRTNGVQVPTGQNNGAVVTYILDAYNPPSPPSPPPYGQQNVGYSNSLMSAAKMGGGKYFPVHSQGDIANALGMILAEIQAVNSTFASASLPVNTTNRTQDKNQVFIPMFRPDRQDRPLWMGNLKQYQLISLGGSIDLGDNTPPPAGPINAVNPLTGFLTPCAESFWTTDSGTYWQGDAFDTPPAKGTCPRSISGFSSWSDDPDGPLVEKGGVAEVIRKGNNPPATNTTPTWKVNRTVYTLSSLTSTSLVPFTSASLGVLPAQVSLANFILGQDVNGEDPTLDLSVLPSTPTRPSLHGDEIHSRPLPVDYGTTTGVTVYYGSNDGTLRAVDSSSGRERWAFIAPEFYNPAPVLPPATPTGFSRLMNGSPLINYPTIPPGLTPTPTSKDYYFDGSIGLYQSASNSSVVIYPSMRRGGRTIYALDVTNPAAPVFKWKAGCPNQQGNDTGCTAGMSATSSSGAIGQTWSTPIVATVLGHTGPVVIVGGGYDTCEDANTSTPTCTSPNGAAVYVFDALSGTRLATFNTTRSVAADVAVITVATPGVVDYAYAVDTGGNIYRLDFAASQTNWAMHKIAYTNGAGRKFLFAPALLAAPGNQVYVALGSGDREHPLQSEYTFGILNRFYVFKDSLASTASTGALNLDDPTRMDDFSYNGADPGPNNSTNGTTCGTMGVLPTSSMSGWFINLNANGPGEQTVTSAIIAAGMVAFSTNRPLPAAPGTCSNLGAAYGYWLNLFNASGGISGSGQACGGARDAPFVGGGLPPSPVVATVPVGTQVVTVVIGAASLNGGISCGICSQQVSPAIVPTRKALFWKGSGEN
jgi:type IV pilus assembly protein PilY1